MNAMISPSISILLIILLNVSSLNFASAFSVSISLAYDGKDVIVEIRGAAGGDEANIFAGDLYRMYTYYSEKEGWKVEEINA